MPDSEGTRGIGAHELDLDLPPIPERGPPVGIPGPHELFELAEIVIPRKRKIDEARSRDLDTRHKRRIRIEPRGNLSCELAAISPRLFRDEHRDVRCQVTVSRLTGLFE